MPCVLRDYTHIVPNKYIDISYYAPRWLPYIEIRMITKNIKLQWNVEIRRIRRSSAQETTTKTKRAEGKKWNCKQQNGKDADAFAMDGKHLNFLVYACCSFVNQYKLSNAQAYTAIPWNMIIDRYAYKYNHGKLWRSSIGLLSVFIGSNAYFSISNEM